MISGVGGNLPLQYFRPNNGSCEDGSCDSSSAAASARLQEEQQQASKRSEAAEESSESGASDNDRDDADDRAASSSDSKNSANSQKAPNGEPLDDKELQQVQQMKQRDQEVRSHEAAHMAAAGQYARGGASFSYETGPDGKRYAVGGEVSIDTSPIPGDPEATLQKANTIRAAASAPAEPSSQDRRVAAEAAQMATEARQQIAEQTIKSSTESDSASSVGEENTRESTPTGQYQAIANMDTSTHPGERINYSV